MRVLIVEDDVELRELMADGLRAEAYAVDLAGDAGSAIDRLISTCYDLACIDLGLPDGDGLELVRTLARSDVLNRPRRIIITTARDAVADRVAGLDSGADDYLVKPFALAELTARLRALERRNSEPDARIVVGEIEIDLATRVVRRRGEPVLLTAKEFAVLRYLAHRPGEVVSLEDLHDHVWDANADPISGSARVILSRLRRKLGEPSPITTITGAGYRLEVLQCDS